MVREIVAWPHQRGPQNVGRDHAGPTPAERPTDDEPEMLSAQYLNVRSRTETWLRAYVDKPAQPADDSRSRRHRTNRKSTCCSAHIKKPQSPTPVGRCAHPSNRPSLDRSGDHLHLTMTKHEGCEKKMRRRKSIVAFNDLNFALSRNGARKSNPLESSDSQHHRFLIDYCVYNQ